MLYMKMEVIPNIKRETLIKFALHASIEKSSTINSDAFRSYKTFTNEGFQLEAKDLLPSRTPITYNGFIQ